MQNQLSSIYDLLIFDWDGTAVENRKADAQSLVKGLNELLEQGVICAIITGTHVENILGQGINHLSIRAKQKLYICTNRGSEVYSFASNGNPQLLFRREATERENQALDASIRKLHDALNELGVQTRIIFDRLNRRKLDLIPIPRWKDPQKSESKALLHDVEGRLKDARITGGIKTLIDQAIRFAKLAGLGEPRVTSDIKHIEIGLTDKSDSIRWLNQHLIQALAIPHSKIVFLGDELGSLDGIPGSDAMMRIPEVSDCDFISVGVEPEGVPPWVVFLGGGPGQFVRFLEFQSDRHRKDPAWLIEQQGFDPAEERDMESRFAIGNGSLGVRGSPAILIPASQPDLLIAGIYDKKAQGVPYSELKLMANSDRASLYSEIVPFPFPFRMRLFCDETELTLTGLELLEHGRTLELKRGLLHERFLFQLPKEGRIHVQTFRCASLAEPDLLIQRVDISYQKISARIHGSFDLDQSDFQLNYPHLKIKSTPLLSPLSTFEHYETSFSNYEVCIGSILSVDGVQAQGAEFSVKPSPSGHLSLRRMIRVITSRDTDNVVDATIKALRADDPQHLETKISENSSKWRDHWDRADIHYSSSPALNQAQRFNLYHLRATTNHDPHVSIGARALTGRAYEGHIFWDTEIFMFPFYLYTQPELARSLILYRYNTLGGAKRRAKQLGFKGACYAWESTVTGDDVTPSVISIKDTGKDIPIFTGKQQIHVTADVAFAVWKFWDATQDKNFLLEFGAEILIETARFWASRAAFDGGVYQIKEVVGPDEYHHSVNNNAYTNWMAKFNLEKALWVLHWLEKTDPDRYRDLLTVLEFSKEEPKAWRHLVTSIAPPKQTWRGVIEQFDGFFNLKDFPLSKDERMKAPVSRLYDWQEINASKIVKQADALMIPFLFPNALSNRKIAANYAYYEPLTDHSSSLSLGVHAAIASRVGMLEQSQSYWEKSLNFDLQDAMGNTSLGVHPGCMGGVWQAMVFHMLGIEFTDRGPEFSRPNAGLPEGCSGIDLKLTYRGKLYPLQIQSKRKRKAA